MGNFMRDLVRVVVAPCLNEGSSTVPILRDGKGHPAALFTGSVLRMDILDTCSCLEHSEADSKRHISKRRCSTQALCSIESLLRSLAECYPSVCSSSSRVPDTPVSTQQQDWFHDNQ